MFGPERNQQFVAVPRKCGQLSQNRRKWAAKLKEVNKQCCSTIFHCSLTPKLSRAEGVGLNE